MHLSKIRIKNYRLLNDAVLEVDDRMTLIVGRNNTAKTSCIDFVSHILKGKNIKFDDYPLFKRGELYGYFAEFMERSLSYADLCEKISKPQIEFCVDYSSESPDDDLGALAPFIIDVDIDINTVLIKAEYKVKVGEEKLRELLQSAFEFKNGKFKKNYEVLHNICSEKFDVIFGLTIYAVNPQKEDEMQLKKTEELSALFPFFEIPAERVLGEDGASDEGSLGALISQFFSISEDQLDAQVRDQVLQLRNVVRDANVKVQKQSDKLLSGVVNSAIGFGYPNPTGEELQLGVITRLNIDEQIKNQTKLTYTSERSSESLPSSYNGLGYKNLIKIEFILAAFAKEIAAMKYACIPLLVIEEPESHMHPQMQRTFAEYLEKFLTKISKVNIQTLLTTHSSHIANSVNFSKIRYAQKSKDGVIYKNLSVFVQQNKTNLDFIQKYLTLSRCDLFFADKVILIEGASERLLIPDMIERCEKEGLFNAVKYTLSSQYYTLIEVGGAYAYKFIPFLNFLGIPCLIITDIDSVDSTRNKVLVSKGTTTSNATIKWWAKTVKSKPQSPVKLKTVMRLSSKYKTMGNCHIEYQVTENGLCGRSLEEAIKNVNREFYEINEETSEIDLTFSGESKTDFALNLIYKAVDYNVPQYIKDGLVWLNNQPVLV